MKSVAAAVLALAAVTAAGAWFAAVAVQQDFAAYWVAGAARQAGLDPYANYLGSQLAPQLWDGAAYFQHSRFLYPPLVAELFRPLAALPFSVAKAIFTVLSVAALLVASALTLGEGGTSLASRSRLLVPAALFFPVYLQLERGQVDLLLLPLLVAAWRWRDRPGRAGAAFAFAAMFKVALFGALPVIAALGRRRWVAATVLCAGVLTALTVLVSGPAALGRYVGQVLPRAALFGEGGTEEMLLPAERIEAAAPRLDETHGRVSIGGRWYRLSIWDGILPWPLVTSASLPRLLAPSEPTRSTSVGPYLVAAAGLIWAARRLAARRASRSGRQSETLFGYALPIGCVIASPAGWTMSFVWALPVVAAATDLRDLGPPGAGTFTLLALSWVACAVPPPVAGWGALAGTALVSAATAVAVRAAQGEASS